VILLTDNDVYSVHEQAETAVVLVIVLALNYLLLLLSDVILRIIGRPGAAILTRVMGIILTALSVQFVLTGLSIGSWATPHRYLNASGKSRCCGVVVLGIYRSFRTVRGAGLFNSSCALTFWSPAVSASICFS
jgi:MarC family integral membrane protein